MPFKPGTVWCPCYCRKALCRLNNVAARQPSIGWKDGVFVRSFRSTPIRWILSLYENEKALDRLKALECLAGPRTEGLRSILNVSVGQDHPYQRNRVRSYMFKLDRGFNM